MSKKKATLTTLYRRYVKLKIAEQNDMHGCTYCERCKKNSAVEPHHTQTRIGGNILVFSLLCRRCHAEIHANTKKARKDGWLSTLS